MSILRIPTAPIFRPLLEPARYLAAFGGRASGKSHFFCEKLVETCVAVPGTRAVCIREIQQSLKESSKYLIESKIQQYNLGSLFEAQHDQIKAPGGGLIIFQGMKDHTAESIKSLEAFDIALIEEGQSLSERSLSLLRPTIRKEGSQVWAIWNPRRKSDAIDKFFREKKPDDAIIVQANWRDNPWFSQVSEQERQLDLKLYPDRYDHIWEGQYAKAFEGAYFAKELTQARQQGRICRLSPDPVLPVKAFCDIGGAGHKADAMAIWIAQFVAREIRILDYIEGVGQPLGYYANELRRKGWGDVTIILPHDGVNTNNITGKRYEDHWRDAGFEVDPPVANQGSGAAMMRIEALRRIFPRCWFNDVPTEPGRDALGYYHERKDELRNVGLGPDHDWSSNAADAAGLMAICYEEPQIKREEKRSRNSAPRSAWGA